MAFALLLSAGGVGCSGAAAPQEQQSSEATALAAHRLQRPAGPVLDAANLLDPADEKALCDQLVQFHSRTGHALVLVTAPSLGGEDVADYTLELYNRWDVNRNGVVLLVAPNERQVRIATGFDMEARVPNQRAARIISERILPHFREGDYTGGIGAGIGALRVAMTSA